MKNLKRSVVVVLAIMAITLAVDIHKSKALALRFAHVAVQGSYFFEVGEKLKENIEKLSGGDIKVNVFPAGQLGNLPQMMGQLKQGSIDLLKDHVGLTSILKEGKDFSVIFAPYMFRDQEHLQNFMKSPVFQEMMGKVEKENSIKSLGYICSRTPRAITTRHKMIRVPEDLKDLKMRAPKVSAIPAIFEKWGASLAVVAAPEMYNALKQKVIDGQDNGIDVVADWKLYEVQKHYTAIDYSRGAECLWVNQKKWESLSSAQKEVIEKAVKATADWADNAIKDLMLKDYYLCQAAGMTIVMPPLEPWYVSAKKVIEDLDGKMWSKGLYEKIQSIK